MKTGLFIDGPSMFFAAKQNFIDINYNRLQSWAEAIRGGPLLRAYYYTIMPPKDAPDTFVSMIPLIDWLNYNGYTVVTREGTWRDSGDGVPRLRGNMDVALACDAVDLSHTGAMECAIIATGSRDFVPLLKSLKRRGVHTIVLSTLAGPNGQPVVADELRRRADRFIDLADIAGDIRRTESEREASQARRSRS